MGNKRQGGSNIYKANMTTKGKKNTPLTKTDKRKENVPNTTKADVLMTPSGSKDSYIFVLTSSLTPMSMQELLLYTTN